MLVRARRSKTRKKRFLSQVVTPASPTYRHKTVGSNGVVRESSSLNEAMPIL